jgi:SAM-dependent methyltransferase
MVFKLYWINFKVGLWNFTEYLQVIAKYYSHWTFAKIDLNLLRGYMLESPYTVSKNFLLQKGEEDIYAYGETPLTTLEKMSKACDIKPEDTVFELGCGRGRTCFWLCEFIGCTVVGIEFIPYFVEQANRVKKASEVKKISFRCEDILLSDLSKATIIYLYGTCFDEFFIKKLIKKFKKLRSGTKIITISYPLTDYFSDTKIKLIKSGKASFPWGTTSFYIHFIN